MEFYCKGEDKKEIKTKEIKKNKKIKEDKNQRLSKRNQVIIVSSLNNKDKINIDFPYIHFQSKKDYLNNKKVYIALMNFNINFTKYFTLLILYLKIFINYASILCVSNKRSFFFKLSEIIIKINRTGKIKILSDNFFNKYNPNSIYINDILQDKNKNEYNFTHHENNLNIVRITWDISIDATKSMFSECGKFVEMDLSKFKASDVITMNGMFSGCTSLISLNLSNIDTSNVEIMSGMFSSCSSLISLNLSNIDTSKVIDMTNLFAGCRELISIDLSNFHTSKVTSMSGMFADCSK